MTTIRFANLAACFGVLALLTGCTPSKEEMMAALEQPARPMELDRLNDFVGTWTSSGTVKMEDEEHATSGRHTSEWSANNWVLVEEWQHDMGEDNQMHGTSLYWWDADSAKYQAVMADSYGGHAEGTMTFDEKTQTWHMKFESEDREGHETVGEGTCTFPNPSTMRWSYTEYGPMKLFKIVEVSGTSKRQ